MVTYCHKSLFQSHLHIPNQVNFLYNLSLINLIYYLTTHKVNLIKNKFIFPPFKNKYNNKNKNYKKDNEYRIKF